MSHGHSSAAGSSRQDSAQREAEPAVAGIPSSWNKQRHLVGIPARVNSMSYGHVQRPGQGHSTGVLPQVLGSRHSRKRNKTSEPATLPHRLPELASLCPWCVVAQHINWKPRNQYQRITLFPEQRVHTETCRGLRSKRDTAEVQSWVKQRRQPGSPSQPNPHTWQLH